MELSRFAATIACCVWIYIIHRLIVRFFGKPRSVAKHNTFKKEQAPVNLPIVPVIYEDEKEELEEEVAQPKKSKKQKVVAPVAKTNPNQESAINALVALGLKKQQAKDSVLAAINGDLEMELDDIIRKALTSKKV